MSTVDERAARRAWIREHHPDRGGPVADFVRGLADFDRASAGRTSAGAGPVLVRRSRRPDRLATRSLRTLRRRLAGQPRRDLR